MTLEISLKKGHRKYKGLSVNTGEFDEHPVNTIILEEIHRRIDSITKYLSQCYLVRFDLTFPASDSICSSPLQENKILSLFWKKLVSDKFKRGKRKHYHLEYFWVREVESSKHGHYHCFIIFDKHKLDSIGSIQNSTGLFGLIQRIWREETGGGAVHIPELAKNGLLVRQVHPHEKDDAFYALSYLAKTRGKYVDTGVRNYGGSIPKKYPIAQAEAVAA